jgi:hypothetical protein
MIRSKEVIRKWMETNKCRGRYLREREKRRIGGVDSWKEANKD